MSNAVWKTRKTARQPAQLIRWPKNFMLSLTRKAVKTNVFLLKKVTDLVAEMARMDVSPSSWPLAFSL